MSDQCLALLLRWYRKNGRRLPWRNTRDAYRIFVSEIMLQQTQVSRVLDYYAPWLKRFPNWKALARAKTDALIRAWAGLGYNRRALYMRDAARSVVANGVPHSIDGWRNLKGVGPYTAAAIYAFTKHKPAAAIDTNIRRVIGRVCFGTPHPNQSDDQKIRRVLATSLHRPSHYQALHALMDLGALICSDERPACASCPLRTRCKAAPIFLKGTATKERIKKRERIRPGKKFPDRIYRGRILHIVRNERSARIFDIGPRADESFNRSKDAKWINEIIKRMVRDGLLRLHRGALSFPKT